MRFVELRAGFFTCDQVICFLAYRSGDVTTGRFDQLFGSFTGEHRKCTGEHKGEAFEGRGALALFGGHGEAEVFESLNESEIAIVREEVVDGDGDLRADIVDAGKRGNIGRDDVLDVAEVRGQRLRSALADVANAE